ncbi:uncharacterized protein LOC111348437 [Spodoptera litura]|uniref:Uncharacterized protein LOC111348437 n=1 Tax=Spodoptera litura TaxID=69820 RepID=A0A9J7IHP2_SPOLT|nr:uncharacterized protein LOC111348437 [Spodoptera litura]
MRPLTALLIVAACQCVYSHQHSRTSRQLLQTTLHSLLGQHYHPIQRIFSCSHELGPTKCLSALSVWRAERAIKAFAQNPGKQFNLTEDVEQFPWKKFSNVSDEQLYTQLYDDTTKLLQYRSLGFDMIPGYNVKLGSKENGTMRVDIYTSDTAETGRSSTKKLQKMFHKYAPFLLVPGLVVSAIIPFILPGLKMMTLMVGMMNSMALMGATFTILRNNAFNDKYQHKVIYVNSGYENEKHFAATNNEEHIHTDHYGMVYDETKNHPQQASNALGVEFDNMESLPPFALNPDWLKAYSDGKIVALMGQDQHIEKKH